MAVQSGEYKSVVGLRDIYYALVTTDSLSAYAAGTPAYFAPAMTASQAPASNQETQYADDGPFDVAASEGETKIEIETTNIPFEVLAAVLGKTFDAATGRMFDNGGTPPDVALSFRSKKSNGSYKYYQYLKGKFSAPEEEHASDTDTPDPKPTKITYTAVKTTYKFDLKGDASLMDGVKRVVGDSDTTNFVGTTWFNAVQVPSAGAPASLTMTADPVDNATNVAVSKTATLTFNNALDGNALHGIALVKASDDSPVACAITIDTARKVITIDPNSNLTASTEHYIVVTNVKDIYGQTYATTIVSFTTA